MDQIKGTMKTCPHCGFQCQTTDIECVKCGIVFKKWEAIEERKIALQDRQKQEAEKKAKRIAEQEAARNANSHFFWHRVSHYLRRDSSPHISPVKAHRDSVKGLLQEKCSQFIQSQIMRDLRGHLFRNVARKEAEEKANRKTQLGKNGIEKSEINLRQIAPSSVKPKPSLRIMSVCLIAILVFGGAAFLFSGCPKSANLEFEKALDYEFRSLDVFQKKLLKTKNSDKEIGEILYENYVAVFVRHIEKLCDPVDVEYFKYFGERPSFNLENVHAAAIDKRLQQFHHEMLRKIYNKIDFYEGLVSFFRGMAALALSVLVITGMIYLARRLWEAGAD